MPAIPGPRRHSERFAQALEQAGSGGDAVLTALRALACGLGAAPLGPSADYRAALRTRLVAVASVASEVGMHADAATPGPARSLERTAPTQAGAHRQRRLAATAGALAGVVALTGVAVAGQHSLPGDSFYGVKRGTEAAQLWLARSDAARGEQHLQRASERLDEAGALAHGEGQALAVVGAPGSVLAGNDPAALVTDTLATMDDETEAGRALLIGVWQRDAQPSALQTLYDFAADQQDRLRALLPVLPDAARSQGSRSLALLGQLDDQTTSLRSADCAASCAPSSPGDSRPGDRDGGAGAATATPGPSAPEGIVPSAPTVPTAPVTTVPPRSTATPTTTPTASATPRSANGTADPADGTAPGRRDDLKSLIERLGASARPDASAPPLPTDQLPLLPLDPSTSLTGRIGTLLGGLDQ